MEHHLPASQIDSILVDMTSSWRASDRVAEQIKATRLRRGLSAKDFAAACAELGAPEITAAVVANIETGRRGPDGARRRDVSVDELLIFAYVLAVPPASLLSANDGESNAITITSNLELA
jgi:transcriptional regulator with XRE-family HTH domain